VLTYLSGKLKRQRKGKASKKTSWLPAFVLKLFVNEVLIKLSIGHSSVRNPAKEEKQKSATRQNLS
jgi:hypothetical protein